MARYQLVLSQADEAPFEAVAAAYEQLVQTVRVPRTKRIIAGQPWLAIESWLVPPRRPGETGTAALMLLCPSRMRETALAALRHAYPDITLRPDPAGLPGHPLECTQDFVPAHVMRVRKARTWALPIGAPSSNPEASNVRSTMAGVIRQQQQTRQLSCVRWCITPTSDRLDGRAIEKLERRGESRSSAISSDVQQSLQSIGGAMAFLELQAAIAVDSRVVNGRRLTFRRSFVTLQSACRQLLSPALSQRGTNHLAERLMYVRQRLYRRRWARGEPPLLPDPAGSTLVSPRELALLMALPSLGSEHALPLQRNTVPHLPLPTGVPRARLVEMPFPPAREDEHPATDHQERPAPGRFRRSMPGRRTRAVHR